jgi:hypothetical protein
VVIGVIPTSATPSNVSLACLHYTLNAQTLIQKNPLKKASNTNAANIGEPVRGAAKFHLID